jgi:hypothetical protein
MQWEDALGVFASSTQSEITRRDGVAADGGASWFASHAVETKAAKVDQASWDFWWSYQFSREESTEYGTTTTAYTTIVGLNLDWSKFGDDSPLAKFNVQPQNILTPLVWSPNQNDRTSVWSFDAAVTTLRGLDAWLTGWMPVINGWADAVNAPDADFQGSAAAVFRFVLRGFATELGTLHLELNTPEPYWTSLETARTQLGATHVALWNGYSAWRANRRSMPVNCVHDAFMDAMATAKPPTIGGDSTTATVTIETDIGNPQNQDFWDRVQHNAKQYWLTEVSTALDAAAGPAMDALNVVYQKATLSLPDIGQTTLPAAPQPDPADDPGDPSNPEDKTEDGKGLDPGVGAGGGGADGAGLGDGPGGKPSTSITPGSSSTGGTGDGFGTPLIGPGTTSGGGEVPLLKDGKQVTDPKTGLPMMVPTGTTVGKNGELIGPDGRPLLGRDGKPMYAPKGAEPGTRESIQPGATGHVADATVPKGSTIGSDGVVRSPDGKTVVDANGNPVVVAKGGRITKDGTILGPDGKPVSEQSQLLDNEEHAMLHPQLLPRPKTASGTGLTGLETGRLAGTGSGLSERAVAEGARLTPEQLAARESAAGEQTAMEAAEEAQMMGRQMATSGGEPMIPPMGGMGGGGAGGGQDRQRTTWLAEDEEVWGTESGAVSGVIGR